MTHKIDFVNWTDNAWNIMRIIVHLNLIIPQKNNFTVLLYICRSLMLNSVCKISFRVINQTWKCSFQWYLIYMHLPAWRASAWLHVRLVSSGCCGCFKPLIINRFFCSTVPILNHRAAKLLKRRNLKSQCPRREHASKEALFFLLFLFILLSHHHTLSLLFYFPFFLFYFPFISQWGVSLLCPPVWAGVESSYVSPPLVHYVWARQIRRSAAGRSEMLSYLHLPDTVQAWFISQARTRSRTKAVSSSASDVSTPTAVTPFLLQ